MKYLIEKIKKIASLFKKVKNEKAIELYEEIKNAQDNNKNQMWYEMELNKLWFSYNPFNRKLYNIKTKKKKIF